MKIRTVDNFVDCAVGEAPTKQVFTLTTEKTQFKANTLDDVLRLWMFSDDNTTVRQLDRIG